MINGKKPMDAELRRVIQTDLRAGIIVERAKEACSKISGKTQQEIEEIQQECKQRIEQMRVQVRAEQAALLEEKKNQEKSKFEERRKALEDTVQKNKDTWIEDMTKAILEA
ncbi:MAG: hypothetical protein ACK5JF_04470 [Oscillospiraceae bacterium]